MWTRPGRIVATLSLTLTLLVGLNTATSDAASISPQIKAALARTLAGVTTPSQVESRDVCSPETPNQVPCDLDLIVYKRNGKAVMLKAPHPSFSSEQTAAQEPAIGTAAYLQRAYDLEYLSNNRGSGATVGIIDSDPDPTAASDLATFRAQNGLPACTTASGCLTIQDDTGEAPAPVDADWDYETSLDLDAVSSICPLCKIVLIEEPGGMFGPYGDGFKAAHDLGAHYISASWGMPIPDQPSMFGSASYSFPDESTFASTGDYGYNGDIQFPADSSSVTAVGGTSVAPDDSNARGVDETAWSYGSSSCVTFVTKPAWQKTDHTGCAGRTSADISADGDPLTGLEIYDTSYAGNGWMLAGGTSLSSPLTAAYAALLGTAGDGPAWAYRHASVLNDITGGSNCAKWTRTSYVQEPGICNATTGYDGPTGNGSISGDVVSGPPQVASDGAATTTIAHGKVTIAAGVYTNGLRTSAHLEYWPAAGEAPPAADVKNTGSQTLKAARGASLVTFNLRGLTSNNYEFRVIATNASGTSYGYESSVAATEHQQFIARLAVTSTTEKSATVSFTSLSPLTGAKVSWGANNATQHSRRIGARAAGRPGSLELTNLILGTTYHLRFTSTDSGQATYTSSVLTFTTPDPLRIKLATPVRRSATTERISFTITGGLPYTRTWYLIYSGGGKTRSTKVSQLGSNKVSLLLRGLRAHKRYRLAVVARTSAGAKRVATVTFTA